MVTGQGSIPVAVEAMRAGAAGFSSSRLLGHRSMSGEVVPGTFAEEAELSMFELLIGVTGIGPTSALTVLSGIPLNALRTAIFEERVSDLAQVRGIGKKTAERVVVELKDKIQATSAEVRPGEGKGVASAVQEATMALIALGFQAPAARKAMESAQKKYGGDATVQELIRHALRDR